MIKNSNILLSMTSHISSISNQRPYHLPMGLQWEHFAQEGYYLPNTICSVPAMPGLLLKSFTVERQPMVHLYPPYAGSCISPHASCTCNYLVFTTTELTESFVGRGMI